mmetsp:Transcript_86265/g.200575  ORF Transcript_86265/g.200575 Transcript_86265/m.200575 type:complete len:116 (-) Transcript_86265:112-459(-)
MPSDGDAAASAMPAFSGGCFFELSWEAPCLYMRRPAKGLTLLVDGTPVEQPAHALLGNTVIGLGGRSGGPPRIAFRVFRDSAMEQEAIDAWLFRPELADRPRGASPEAVELVYHL